MGLSELELEALTAAAVLHDIGKLAVRIYHLQPENSLGLNSKE